MTPFDPETVDLATLAAHLRAVFGEVVAGAVVGRTRLRDEVAGFVGCSQLEAEQLVDTMVNRGFVVLKQVPGSLEHWTIRVP